MKSEILQGFQKLKEKESTGNGNQSVYIVVLPVDPYFSCNVNENSNNTHDLPVDYLFQSEVKKKLKNVKENSKVLKFFQDNNCSVCLSNY